ncbi:MAG: transporter [Acidobacteriota bacterium]
MRLRAVFVLVLSIVPAAARAQAAGTPIATDRPGFLFSSLTAGRGVVQAELGLPAVTLQEKGDVRTTSLVGLLRVGLGDDFELRLGGPFLNETRVEAGGRTTRERGYGDLEIGFKWHAVDNDGGRPSFALIPSVILPVGKKGFSAGDPVWQLNTATEWTLDDGWATGLLAGFLRGDGVLQQTYGALLGRTVGPWSPYLEAVYVATDREDSDDSSFLGGGLKVLLSDDVQIDLNFDRGLTDESPDWLFGFGLGVRF